MVVYKVIKQIIGQNLKSIELLVCLNNKMMKMLFKFYFLITTNQLEQQRNHTNYLNSKF